MFDSTLLPNLLYLLLVGGLWLAALAVVTPGSGGYELLALLALATGGAGVNPLLALISTLGSVGFFWIVVRNVRKSQRAEPVFDLRHILGQVGEARTPIDPIGS